MQTPQPPTPPATRRRFFAAQPSTQQVPARTIELELVLQRAPQQPDAPPPQGAPV